MLNRFREMGLVGGFEPSDSSRHGKIDRIEERGFAKPVRTVENRRIVADFEELLFTVGPKVLNRHGFKAYGLSGPSRSRNRRVDAGQEIVRLTEPSLDAVFRDALRTT